MLKANIAETCRNIRSVHITLATYRFITPTHFLFNGFRYQHGTLDQSLEFQKSYTEASSNCCFIKLRLQILSPDIKYSSC